MKSCANALQLFCLVFMLSSCKKDNLVDSSLGEKQIWPLKLGNAWTYHQTNYDTVGSIIQWYNGSKIVTMDTIVHDETWYGISDDYAFCANKSDGFWQLSGSFQGLRYKYPASAGDNWYYGGARMYLLSTDTLITVPAGTYHCYKYRYLWNSIPVVDDYFCPGVGLIAEDWYSRTNSGRLYKYSTLDITLITLN